MLMQWRNEIVHEKMFETEVTVPMRPGNNNFEACAALAAELFDLWRLLGISYQARRKTLRGFHSAAQREEQEEFEEERVGNRSWRRGRRPSTSVVGTLLTTMQEMKLKLEQRLLTVRREMAAVRRCDALLRQRGVLRRCEHKDFDQINTITAQLGKISGVLLRVLSKWEQNHQKSFMFRGFRYLDLMDQLMLVHHQ